MRKLRQELALANKRFNAWWEGYAFDAAMERAAIIKDASAPSSPVQTLTPEQRIACDIWGEGRLDPGDAAWTMRHARTLGVALKSRVVVLGAGLGGPIEDLKSGTRWKVSGFSRIQRHDRASPVRSYDEALTRLPKAEADAGICLFEFHRDADPAALSRFAFELVRPNSPFAFVDFTVARKGARLKACFAEPWGGSPRTAQDTAAFVEEAGFRVLDTVDESRALTQLIIKGWSRWRKAYDRALAEPASHARLRQIGLLSEYSRLWAERFDALKAGHLQATRLLVRRGA